MEAQRGGINRIRAVNQALGSPFILLIPTLVAWAWDNNHPKLRWSKKHKPRVEYISCRGDVTECPEELFFVFERWCFIRLFSLPKDTATVWLHLLRAFFFFLNVKIYSSPKLSKGKKLRNCCLFVCLSEFNECNMLEWRLNILWWVLKCKRPHKLKSSSEPMSWRYGYNANQREGSQGERGEVC